MWPLARFFPTQTKNPKSKAAPEILSWWQENMQPPVAIGGIQLENAPILIAAGADFLLSVTAFGDMQKAPNKR